jgi:hypothetical protein
MEYSLRHNYEYSLPLTTVSKILRMYIPEDQKMEVYEKPFPHSGFFCNKL